MKQQKFAYIALGIALAALLWLVVGGSATEPNRRGSAVQIGAPPSTVSGQKGGAGQKPSVDPGDGFGSLYAAATYRISAEGCNPGEAKVVRDISRGPGISLLPSSTDCVMYTFREPEGDHKGVYIWTGRLSFVWPQTPNLYVQTTSGLDANVIDFTDPTLPAGRFSFQAFLGFSGDRTPVLDPNPFLFFFFSFEAREDDTRAELELATAIIDRFASGSLVSTPVLVYASPSA